MLSTRIIIPTRNAAEYLPVSLPILTSVVAPEQILIIDSASRDRTLEIAREFGVQVHSIDQSKFNHGDTRNLGRQLGCAETDVLIYMTQDAIPVDGSFLTELLKPFEDENVGMVYGRHWKLFPACLTIQQRVW
jgi:rhamnosyltransferase